MRHETIATRRAPEERAPTALSRLRPVAFFVELRRTLRLAAPIAAGLAAHGTMLSIDTLLLGRSGETPLAAAGFAGNLMLLPLVFGYGLLVGAPILAAQGRGAGDGAAAARASRRTAITIALAYGLFAAIAIHLAIAAGALRLLGQPPEIAAAAAPFGVFMGWTIVPAMLFQGLKNAAEADERPWTPLAWLVAGLALNALFAYAFILGRLGAPAMGVAGAGLATLLARILMLAGLAFTERERIAEALAKGVTGNLIRAVRLGFPCGCHWLSECGVFTAAPVFIGWKFGVVHLAAHQVTMSVASLAFMFPLGLAQASGIRVGEAHGAGDRARVRTIGRGAMLVALVFMGAYALTVLLFRDAIAGAYHPSPEAGALARSLLAVAAGFALADGLQTVCAGLLRGLGDTTVPSVIAIVSYWVLGLPTGMLLAVTVLPGALGVWSGLATGLFLAAIGLSWRWRRFSRLRRTEPGA